MLVDANGWYGSTTAPIEPRRVSVPGAATDADLRHAGVDFRLQPGSDRRRSEPSDTGGRSPGHPEQGECDDRAGGDREPHRGGADRDYVPDALPGKPDPTVRRRRISTSTAEWSYRTWSWCNSTPPGMETTARSICITVPAASTRSSISRAGSNSLMTMRGHKQRLLIGVIVIAALPLLGQVPVSGCARCLFGCHSRGPHAGCAPRSGVIARGVLERGETRPSCVPEQAADRSPRRLCSPTSRHV